MTVIVYRDGVMASDSLLSGQGVRCGEAEKVRDINGWLIGISGNWGVACELFDWFEQECRDSIKRPPSQIHVDDDKYPIGVLLVRKSSGAVFCIDGLGYPQRINAPFYAIGSGAEVALGAMEMGADAIKAVKAACKFNCYCGGRIRHVRMEKKKPAG